MTRTPFIREVTPKIPYLLGRGGTDNELLAIATKHIRKAVDGKSQKISRSRLREELSDISRTYWRERDEFHGVPPKEARAHAQKLQRVTTELKATLLESKTDFGAIAGQIRRVMNRRRRDRLQSVIDYLLDNFPRLSNNTGLNIDTSEFKHSEAIKTIEIRQQDEILSLIESMSDICGVAEQFLNDIDNLQRNSGRPTNDHHDNAAKKIRDLWQSATGSRLTLNVESGSKPNTYDFLNEGTFFAKSLLQCIDSEITDGQVVNVLRKIGVKSR